MHELPTSATPTSARVQEHSEDVAAPAAPAEAQDEAERSMSNLHLLQAAVSMMDEADSRRIVPVGAASASSPPALRGGVRTSMCAPLEEVLRGNFNETSFQGCEVVGSLGNGKLVVKESNLPAAGRGLFAAVKFWKDEPVCVYGGELVAHAVGDR